MQSVAVIKHGYIVQDILLGLMSCLVTFPLHPFLFQAAEEALDHGIIPTMSFPAHTAFKSLGLEQPPKGFAKK